MKNRIQRIHLIGIGGTGMCGIAEVLQGLGYRVSGSDQAQSAVTDHLANLGVKIFIGHAPEHIVGAEVVVTSTAVHADNPEVVAAEAAHIPVIPRALMLAELMRFKEGVAVAGTHGKTTTTSLTASLLAAGGLDPTFVIGGRLNAAGTNARLGQGEYLVAEADESDASFLYLSPLFTIVTNIDEDHMDTYGHDIERLYRAFIDFVHRMPFYGRAFLCADDAHVKQILPRINKPYTTYGLSETADIYASDIRAVGTQMLFCVHVKHPKLETFDVVLNLAGRHNVANALAAIGVALECGVSVAAIQEGLAHFQGVGRRFQQYGAVVLPDAQGRAWLIDDYGHHPTEMRATITAVRAAFPKRRLVLAFQPHRFSRTRDLFEDFVAVLKSVDVAVLTDVYAAGEEAIIAADSRALARALRTHGVEPIYQANVQALATTLLHTVLQDGDIVLTMGAGSISHVPAQLMALSQK